MTKTDIAQFVADKLQTTDGESITMLKSFIDRRYEMIWNTALWREALGTTTYTVAAETEEVNLDSTVDFPVAARWDDKEIVPMDYSAVFQIDPTLFNDSGAVVNFLVLPKTTSGAARIKLLRKPDEGKNLLVLGKLKLVSLNDGDSPKINGIDNILISMVEGDMLEHTRQYGKAQMKFQEAMNQLKIAKDMENHQSASITRIIPEVPGHWNTDSFV